MWSPSGLSPFPLSVPSTTKHPSISKLSLELNQVDSWVKGIRNFCVQTFHLWQSWIHSFCRSFLPFPRFPSTHFVINLLLFLYEWSVDPQLLDETWNIRNDNYTNWASMWFRGVYLLHTVSQKIYILFKTNNNFDSILSV